MAVNLCTRMYQNTAADTADPNHTVVLLFEGAVRFLHQAQAAMQQKNYEDQCDNIIRVQRILSVLLTALDETVDPQICLALRGTYTWLHANLTEASLNDDLELLAVIIGILVNLRDAWRHAEQNVRTEPHRVPDAHGASGAHNALEVILEV